MENTSNDSVSSTWIQCPLCGIWYMEETAHFCSPRPLAVTTISQNDLDTIKKALGDLADGVIKLSESFNNLVNLVESISNYQDNIVAVLKEMNKSFGNMIEGDRETYRLYRDFAYMLTERLRK